MLRHLTLLSIRDRILHGRVLLYTQIVFDIFPLGRLEITFSPDLMIPLLFSAYFHFNLVFPTVCNP